MSTQTCSIAYGKANLSTTLVSYACMKVSAPFNRVSAVTNGVRVGRSNAVPVGTHEMNGVLISQQIQHENGTVILLTASWKRSGGSLRDGSLFLRLRHGAPTHNIIAKIPTGLDNVCGDRFSMFTGMADIMNVEELGTVGIEVNRSYASRFMDEEEIDECFQIVQLSKGANPRPALTAINTVDGVQMREVVQVPNRRLVLRRGR